VLVGLKITEPRAFALRYSVRHGNVAHCLHGREVSLIKRNRFVPAHRLPGIMTWAALSTKDESTQANCAKEKYG
jgi:hypothetical protein